MLQIDDEIMIEMGWNACKCCLFIVLGSHIIWSLSCFVSYAHMHTPDILLELFGKPAPSHYCTEKQKANSTRLWSGMLSIAPNLIWLAVIWSHSGPILSKRKKSKEAFSLFNCSHTQCFDVLTMANWRKQHRTNWDVSNQLLFAQLLKQVFGSSICEVALFLKA